MLLTSCVNEKEENKIIKKEPVISLYINETGKIKNIKLEEYLAGVVAAEMKTDWPVNALAAQAILACTFTLEAVQRGKIKRLHGKDAFTSIEEFQAYEPEKINNRALKAIEDSRGKVIKYNGEYVKGWYSACCGGKTAGALEGLNWDKTKTPYIKPGIKCRCMELTKQQNKSWTAKIPLNKVKEVIKDMTGQKPMEITSVSILEKGPSGRTVKVRLGDYVVNFPEFRIAIGEETIRSTLIKKIEIKDNNLVITGDGFGHGLGLYQ